jgi:tetratricopeptide (TPR) repeat protein
MAALLCAVTVLAYVPALGAGFVWDDDTFLTRNRLIKAADGLLKFWFSREPADYWPMTSTTLWAEWRLWGMNAHGYHATNLALHVLDALLLWRVLARLRLPGAYLAALIFAVHPVNVESVAWITQRKNLVALLFFLLAILCFLRTGAGRRTGEQGTGAGRGWYALSLAAFALAMLSKGSVALLPLVLLGILCWRRRPTLGDLGALMPFFAVAAVFTVVDIWFQRHGSAVVIRSAGPLERLCGAGAVVWFYLYKALLPLNLVFVYPQWHIRADDPRWWLGLVAAALVTLGLWRWRGRAGRPLLYAWGYFCLMLVPVMGFTDVYFMKYALVADHYAHLALIGVASAAAAGWAVWDRRAASRVLPRAAAAAAVAALAWQTWRQCTMYTDVETLWRATIARNPGCWVAYGNLGDGYLRDGRLPEAVDSYEKAIAIDGTDAESHNDLGVALLHEGREDAAAAQFQAALAIDRGNSEAHNNLGNIFYRRRRLDDALQEYRKALETDPADARAHFNLGNVLMRMGRVAGAASEYASAVALGPGDADAHADLAAALTQLGREGEAIAQYQAALALDPSNAGAHLNLGAIYLRRSETDSAVAQFRSCVELNDRDLDARFDLGSALIQAGRLDEAIAQFRRILQSAPGDRQAHHALGVALFKRGRADEADAEFKASLAPGREGPPGR